MNLRSCVLTLALSALTACSSSSNTDSGNGGGGGGGIGSGGGTGTGGGGSAITADQACTASAQARCLQEQTCSPNTLAIDYGDLATCQARLKATCLAALSATATGSTPATVSGCANAYPTWNCADWANDVVPTACLPAHGALANGTNCAFGAQCTSGYCTVPRGASCGFCSDAPDVGTACGGGIGCGTLAPLYCDANTNTCQALVVDAGSFCDAGSCGYGLGCVIANGMSSGTCQLLGNALDAGCDAQQRTAPACDRQFGFACVRKHCAVDPLASPGQTCGLDLDAGDVTECNAGGDCYSDGGASTCIAPQAEGLACDTANGKVCLTPARCVSADGGATDGGPVVGTCALPSGALCQ